MESTTASFDMLYLPLTVAKIHKYTCDVSADLGIAQRTNGYSLICGHIK